MSLRRFASAVGAVLSAALLVGACTGGSDQDASNNDAPASLPASDNPSGTAAAPGPTTPSASPTPSGPQLPAESYLPAPSVGDRWVYSLTSAEATGQTVTDTETITAIARQGAAQVLTVQRVLTYDDGSRPDVTIQGSYVLGDDGALTVRFTPRGPDPSPLGVVSGEIAIPAWAALQSAPATGSVATGGLVSTTLTWSASSVGTTQVQVPSGAYTARVVGIDLLGGDNGLMRAVLYTADGVGPVRVDVQASGRIVTVAQLVKYDPA